MGELYPLGLSPLTCSSLTGNKRNLKMIVVSEVARRETAARTTKTAEVYAQSIVEHRVITWLPKSFFSALWDLNFEWVRSPPKDTWVVTRMSAWHTCVGGPLFEIRWGDAWVVINAFDQLLKKCRFLWQDRACQSCWWGLTVVTLCPLLCE